MVVLQSLLLLGLLIICCWGPGYLFVRRLPWSPNEKICASIGLSLILLYLFSGATYLTGISWSWCWAMTAFCAASALWTMSDARRLLQLRRVRRQFAGFGFLLVVSFLLLSVTRHYSGGDWSGDWLEHYQRAGFFVERWDYGMQFLEMYTLPARPPMMNLLVAYFLAHVGLQFDVLQLVFMFLNLLVYFPCVLLAGLLVRRGNQRIWLIVAFLAASPVFQENATYAWTKLLAGFFIVLSLALYLRGWRRNDPARIIAAAASMAAALLVHYSAGPYALVLGLHYPFIFFRRKHRLLELLGSAGAVTALLASWLAWSIVIYGPSVTFGSNTAVTDAERLTLGGNVGKIAQNVFNTFIPHPLRISNDLFLAHFGQPNEFGYVRDYCFLMYQTSLPLTMGIVGWAVAAWLTVRQLRRTSWSEFWFWVVFLVLIPLVGIAVHGASSKYGLSHICLQPLTMIGLTLLAAGYPLLAPWLRFAVAGAMAFDVAAGILLQFRMQMYVFRIVPSAEAPIIPFSDRLLSIAAVKNSLLRFKASNAYWGDNFSAVGDAVFAAAIVLLGVAVFIVARAVVQDRTSPRRRVFAGCVVGFYVVLATLSASDRLLGYRAEQPPVPANGSPLEASHQLESLRRAATAAPMLPGPQYDIGIALYNSGRPSAAATYFGKALLRDRANLQAAYALSLVIACGVDSLGQIDRAEAEDSSEKWGDIMADYVVASGLLMRGHADVAEQRMLSVVATHPGSSHAHHCLAMLLFRMGKTEQAIQQCQEALAIEPSSTEIANHLRQMQSAHKRATSP
jgi:tetratricopeptide (TPR) repeat protein